MSHEPKWLRQTGRVLSSLIQADDDGLAEFVKERLDGAEVPPERAGDARALLIQIGEALREPTPERLMSLEYTRRMLEDWQPDDEAAPAPAPEPNPAPPAAPVVVPPVAPAPAPPPVAVNSPAPSPPVIQVPPAVTTPSPWAGSDAPPNVDQMAMTADGAEPPSEDNYLPFAKAEAARPPAKISLEPHDAMGQTAPIGQKRPKGLLPFGGKAPPMTLEQYAYFCAERALWPDHQAQTCKKFGVEAGYEPTLHAEYLKVLSVDRALQAKFNKMRESARAQLSG